ncbi:ER membrane protein complex subunit 8/9 homolog [Macadamia integrifolia]|uniref:ER membrane protein complex subunit 8/9 homolog n=1 Tax=Macadamia integrifolia TaxID=60698 RepID=UPI001C4E7ACA|nr:ER membrane protein complex subunit 8/9 homolog [Macadamia integrifolia]
MGSELKYEIGQKPYIKLILHALKHKTSAVNGILVGSLGKNDEVIDIVDAVPLSHSQISLLPTLEIALTQIEEHFGAQGLSIVGYYHANERYDNFELGNASKKIGDHICRYFAQAAVLLLDNQKLETLPKGKDRNPALQLYIRDASKNWKQAGLDGSIRLSMKEPAANVVLLDYISSEKWRDIVDFDDHLDDISNDWLNPDLVK